MYSIFDEFVGGGELSTFLLYHLGLVTYICFFFYCLFPPHFQKHRDMNDKYAQYREVSLSMYPN